ncbi:SDR family oxidoreductase [Phycisphaerales bacterium AB-hyl4]|uniref:SDR family oxidoreductase n=1 Tax=Natronomicrosphaera hydrolytica TaxID=3242702 RepID=A0ABV4U100_9BACT
MTRPAKNPEDRSCILLTGATGYVGGRLVPRLLEAGYRVRCVVRSADKLAARPWANDPNIESVELDLSDTAGLARAMRGCWCGYYLVHSMQSGRAYADADRQLASSFADAAEQAGLERIIYLGGLGEMGDDLSEHLRSRRDVEHVLAQGSVPVTVLRAAMVIGSGSASFEILRYLVERLPVMITPRWVQTLSQPIAIRDLIGYLVACLSVEETVGRTIDVGGPDIVSYERLMRITSEVIGLPRRWIVPVPLLTPRLSSLWIHLVTPVSFRIARPLAEGLRNPVVCRDDLAQQLMPQPLLSVEQAISFAVQRTREQQVQTVWSGAGVIPGDPDWAGGTVLEDRREYRVNAPADAVFNTICRLGGRQGYFAYDLLWQVRGGLDRLVGGPGLRRGRRDPQQIAFGDALDFWRVVDYQPGRQLTLRAEMKVPGEAVLQFNVEHDEGDNTRCLMIQTARFRPRGLGGIAYWYALLPMHALIFGGMQRGIARAAISQL